MRRNDLERNKWIEEVYLPEKRKEWEKGLQGWIDGIIKDEQSVWEGEFRKKYNIY